MPVGFLRPPPQAYKVIKVIREIHESGVQNSSSIRIYRLQP